MKALTMFIMSVSSLCLLSMVHKNLLVCQLLDITYGYPSSAKKTASAAPPLRSLPPTSEAFREHVRRAHLIAAQILSSDEPHPPNLSPLEYGWTYDELSKCFDPVILPSGVETAPVEVLQLIRCGCSSDKPCQSARCSCYSAHVKYSVFCVCHGLCSNKNIEDDNNDYELNHNLNI